MNFKLLILVPVLSILVSCRSNSQINWQTDIAYLKNELPKKHKDLFFKYSKAEFENKLNLLVEQLGTVKDFEVVVKLQQIIAGQGDSHTMVNWYRFNDDKKDLPIRMYWFSDGIYVIKASKEIVSVLGKKLVSINNHPLTEIIDSLSTMLTVDNQAIVRNRMPFLLRNARLLDYFGFAINGRYVFEVEDVAGQRSKINIIPQADDIAELISFENDSTPLYWQNRQIPFIERYLKNDSIYYIQYNRCDSRLFLYLTGNWQRARNTPSFSKFEKTIIKTLGDKEIKKLVFDMRFNPGGSSFQGKKLIKQLADIDKINQRGKLYVIIGRKTFSSAILNTIDFLNYTQAILVGEETGGKPNHFGEIKSLMLPTSKLEIYYSTKYFHLSNKYTNTITPDVQIESGFSDFVEGRDPVYEWIKLQD
jgi:hypothetical protein